MDGDKMKRNHQGKNNPNFKGGLCKVSCDICNKYIYIKLYRLKRSKRFFCSTECHGIWLSKNNINKDNPMFGKHHTEKTKKLMTINRIGKYRGRKSSRFGKSSHGRWGNYKGIRMRSSWEIKYAKYLDKNKISWQYESKTFDLGNTTYTPDFYLSKTNEYIEIKGFWRIDAKKKFKQFKKQYSKIKITVLREKDLKDLQIIK
jgi:hypothetical protein